MRMRDKAASRNESERLARSEQGPLRRFYSGEETKVETVRIPRSAWLRLERVRKTKNASMSFVINEAITAYLKTRRCG